MITFSGILVTMEESIDLDSRFWFLISSRNEETKDQFLREMILKSTADS